MIALAAALLAAGGTVYAEGNWAAFDRGFGCAAVARAERIARDPAGQAHASIAFDRAGRRRGEFAARLSRPARPGGSVLLTIGDRPFLMASANGLAWSRGPAQEAAILAAMRAAPSMRIEARSAGGARFADRYLLAGAPGAIDAAAACAAKR